MRRFVKFNIINNIPPLSAFRILTGASGRSKMNFLSGGKLMNKLIAALIAGAFALGSVAAMAADEDNPAYKMGMASQRQHDLELD